MKWQIVSFAPTVQVPLPSRLPLWHVDFTNDEILMELAPVQQKSKLFSHVVAVRFYLVEVCNRLQLYQRHQQALQPCLTVPTRLPVINVNSFFHFNILS
jgi:hypothetical protein